MNFILIPKGYCLMTEQIIRVQFVFRYEFGIHIVTLYNFIFTVIIIKYVILFLYIFIKIILYDIFYFSIFIIYLFY